MSNRVVKRITTTISWQEITPGGAIYDAGSSASFRTGDWSSFKPVLNESKCRRCFLCIPVCPDSVITIYDDKPAFNLSFCKGCGICVKVCSFSALTLEKESV